LPCLLQVKIIIMEAPSFLEDSMSQIPTIMLLMKMGWEYLSPEEVLEARGGRYSNVLLENILKQQLQKINKIEYKKKEFAFSEANITNALLTIRDLPVQNGFLAANQYYYDLITLGKSFEQTVLGDKKGFSFQYIDWKNPANNVYHIAIEYSVLRAERADLYRPDIVLFVNGIPMVVIECKSPKIKDPIDKAIEQHLRNQQEDGIRSLYLYSNITMALATHEAKYATTATSMEFWGKWKEMFRTKEEERKWEGEISRIKHASLPNNERTALFKDRFKKTRQYFDNLEKEEQVITGQDRLLYSFCRPEQLLDFMHNYIVYDDGIKKIARYPQYFAIRNTMARIVKTDAQGRHEGGVIWHTQGSGKSLTMVMLAQLIASHSRIRNPKIILVTDRIDLDDQITSTFRKCQIPVQNADAGASAEVIKRIKGEILTEHEMEKLKKDSSLLKLLSEPGDVVITTLIHKFEAAVKAGVAPFDSPDIFVLVDEGHRSQYGNFNIKMRQMFPNACFIAFTGTPLMKAEKNTADKFGGIIDIYSITDAVADGAVVPLLFEGRHNLIEVNEKPLDSYFDKVAEPLTIYGRAAMKRKYSSKSMLNKADQIIYARAWDITEHYVGFFQHTGSKGQLVAPSKATAIKYKEYMDEIGRVSSEVIISAPDTREGEDDAFDVVDDKVKKFWNARMDKYGSPEKYEKSIINAFKKQDSPEIIIVVDKLLTGFDAPRNTVLYLTRSLKEHTLLQAIARVNRVNPGKQYGYIIDYFGNLEHLDKALRTYSGEKQFELEDVEGSWTDIAVEAKKLPQAHSELWDIFKTTKNKYDEPAYEEFLSDESIRHRFYEKVSIFSRLLKMALSSLDFVNNTPATQVDKYKADARFFLALRISVKRRYSDDIDYKEFEPQVQKLIDKHITTDGVVLQITELVNIFDRQQREAEVEKITGNAAKADHIASRTIRAINIKMHEDPIFFEKLSKLIKDAIRDYHQHRIDEAAFLKRAMECEQNFLEGRMDNIPDPLKGNNVGIAIFNLVTEIFKEELSDKVQIATELSLGLDHAIRSIVYEDGQLIVDWQNKFDIEGKIKIAIDDYIFDLMGKYNIELPFASIDKTVGEALKIVKLKFV